MRAFPRHASRAVLATVVVAAFGVLGGGATATPAPTVAELQVRLVQARMHVNALYAEAAKAAERLNGARYDLEVAEAEITAREREVARTEKSLGTERRSVADLTVEQLQAGTTTAQLTSLAKSRDLRQLLERSAAYRSTQEAMTARIDALTASQVVRDAAVERAREAKAAKADAVRRQRAAQAEIGRQLAAAEAAERQALAERDALLQQLAAATGDSLENVTDQQDQIDQQLDSQGPSVGGPPPAPQPTTPPPTSGPTTGPNPLPTVPAPSPTPTQPPPPPPPPATDPGTGTASATVEKAIAFAKAQLGEAYEWGGDGPSTWDCSGLTMRAYQAAGIGLAHYAGAQYSATKHVAVKDRKRGDLLFWSDGGASSIYHVAIYLGDGQMIHAPRPGRSVEIVPLSYWIMPDLASRPAN